MILENKEQTVFFGAAGAGDFLREQLARFKASRILLVTGRNSFHVSGAEMFLNEVLDLKTTARFSEFGTNLTAGDVCRGLHYLHSANPGCILAVGGGSVLDMAKLLRFYHWVGTYPDHASCQLPVSSIGMLLMIAIPLTAGSGSEATSFAVMYKNGRKVSVEHQDLRPQSVVLNPEFTFSMSAYQTACCGFDAFAQALESYWAVGSTERSRHYSRESLNLCMKHLENAVSSPNLESRTGMMKAAYLAGKAINLSKTTAAHALSYVLTFQYGIPHGHAVAMMLPSVFELNALVTNEDVNDPRGIQYVKNAVDDLCGILGCSSPSAASEWIRNLATRVGLSGIESCGIRANLKDIRENVVRGINAERLGNNPRSLNRTMIEWLAMHVQ